MKDGGYAFPRGGDSSEPHTGMTLRDWFAGQALAGDLAAYTRDQINDYLPEKLAARCYAAADAMIAAREKGTN
jgi:hypothetical protein